MSVWGLWGAVLELSGAKPPPSARTSDTSRISARVSSSASERRADISESSADRTSRYVASAPSYRELTIWCASAAAATAALAAPSSSSRDLRLVAASATSRSAVESVPLYVATAASYSARAPLNWPCRRALLNIGSEIAGPAAPDCEADLKRLSIPTDWNPANASRLTLGENPAFG